MRRSMIYRFLGCLIVAVAASGCSQYQKALKNPDPNYKFEFAKRAFEQKKYVQSYTLLRDVVKGATAPRSRSTCSDSATSRTKNIPKPPNFSKPTISAIPKENSPNSHATTRATPTISTLPKLNLIRARPSKPSKSCRDFSITSRAPTR